MLALWLEHKFSKREIFDLYLNRVYFGAGAYGVEAASQRYFGKSARQVTLAEAAMLAGLVKSPSRLSPARNPDGAERRAHLVLTAMVDAGFISENAAKTAIAQEPQIVKPTAGRLGQLRRRLDHGRPQRPPRQRRAGHRGGNLDRYRRCRRRPKRR